MHLNVFSLCIMLAEVCSQFKCAGNNHPHPQCLSENIHLTVMWDTVLQNKIFFLSITGAECS